MARTLGSWRKPKPKDKPPTVSLRLDQFEDRTGFSDPFMIGALPISLLGAGSAVMAVDSTAMATPSPQFVAMHGWEAGQTSGLPSPLHADVRTGRPWPGTMGKACPA